MSTRSFMELRGDIWNICRYAKHTSPPTLRSFVLLGVWRNVHANTLWCFWSTSMDLSATLTSGRWASQLTTALGTTPFLSRFATSIIQYRAWIKISVWEIHNYSWVPTDPKHTHRPHWRDKMNVISKLFGWPRLRCCFSRFGRCVSWTHA